MNILQAKLKDPLLLTGILLIPTSLLIFSLAFFINMDHGFFGLFMINFILAVSYFFALIFNRKLKIPQHKKHYTFVLLILLLISAYSLNREMNVFDTSPVWFCIVLVIVCFNYIASIFLEHLPKVLQVLVFFVMGGGLVVFTYLAVYLIPLYFISLIGLVAFGIAIHTYIPLLFTYHTLRLASQLAQGRRNNWMAFGAGIILVVVFTVSYAINWDAHKQQINAAYSTSISDGTDQLPAWIQVAQMLPQNNTTERILKTGLVYTVPEWKHDFLWTVPQGSLGEMQKIHDPLVVVASLLSGNVYLAEEEKVKVLSTQFGARHHTEERLWTGKDLTTDNILTNVQVWPQLHMAYTEKIVTVFNHSMGRGFPRQEEAIYTFYLPEGGVVTSLSLWIGGKEEKAVLTTKEKATTAYNGIVGVEQRDPSVVHWQEGNQVTVRVFPVMSDDSRRFKIGITTPLQMDGEHLVYNNIWFDGPDASRAEETIQFKITEGSQSWQHLASSNEKGGGFNRTGRYAPKWSHKIKSKGGAKGNFSFNGFQYSVQPHQPQRKSVTINNIYLDLNKEWTAEEFETIWSASTGKNIWVWHKELVQLTADNRQAYFDELSKLQFSLFPVFAIQDSATSLLITKTGAATPNLSDLENSEFGKKLKLFAAKDQKILLYNLSNNLSPYLASLKDFRIFHYEHGSVALAKELLQKGVFAKEAENNDQVVIHTAGIVITKAVGETTNTAPDHLMRLFAYNHILQQYGKTVWRDTAVADAIITEAKEAYVVSPVSSLIVLETQQDYDRFGIEDAKNSLKNASLKSKGAVPEPHEWVLIILVVSIALVLFIKSRL